MISLQEMAEFYSCVCCLLLQEITLQEPQWCTDKSEIAQMVEQGIVKIF